MSIIELAKGAEENSRTIKIISGGQTGADQGGLETAIRLGLEHGGWCPKGRRCEAGRIDRKYNLKETPSAGWLERTEWNVRDSDVTIIFIGGRRLTGGSALTRKYCRQHIKPMLTISVNCNSHADNIKLVKEFLAEHKPSVINIAGNRNSKQPGIAISVIHILTRALAT